MENEVFCDNCVYLNTFYGDYNCSYKDNVITKTIKTYLMKYDEIRFIKLPSKLNKNNDCKWYEMYF